MSKVPHNSGFSKMGAGTFILRNEPRCLPVPGFRLDDGSFVCGRSSECDLILPHPTVSRRHAALHVAGSEVEVVDLGSRNGIWVNGSRVESGTIRLGDVLAIGKVLFVLADAMNDDDDCGSCFETVSTREVRIPPKVDSPISVLSDAQRRVLNLVMEGLVEKQIATRLKISPHTAHNHVRNIYRALDVHSRAELLARLVWKDGAESITGIHTIVPRRADTSP
jgi:pSer/pThr/pTyr-binding forkhead associated (FHA) protein